MTMSPRQRATKRAIDVVVAAGAMAATAPVLVASAIAVRRTMGTPVLFRQTRPGLHGRPFEMVKLRTMLTPDQAGETADGARLTPLGSWLRSTSIDELPTLWNVLKGDMSLVGPRPLLMEYLPLYSPDQARRHEVKPGLTGLAQVNGRNQLTWDEKFALDVEYVDSATPAEDIKILLKTVLIVFQRSGISHSSSVTMPKFTGSRSPETAGSSDSTPSVRDVSESAEAAHRHSTR